MCEMNFIYGNNFYGGGFGCCCRPMVDPYMIGVMHGYMSSMMIYSQMASMNTPLFNYDNFNLFPHLQGLYNNSQNTNVSKQSPKSTEIEIPENEELNKRYEEASKKWENAFNKHSDKSSSKQTSKPVISNNAGTVGVSAKGKELLSNPDFMYKVQKIASELKCSTEDLLAVMNAESGLNPAAGTNAVGLIQFTSPAIKALNQQGCNITKEDLRKMDAIQQLDYVEKYLKMAKSYSFSSEDKLSAGDLYAIIFMPGRAKRETLAASGEAYYGANRGLDIDKDGKITKDELSHRVRKFGVSLVA